MEQIIDYATTCADSLGVSPGNVQFDIYSYLDLAPIISS